MLVYAGIGSRQISNEEAIFCKTAASILAERGWTLRSGGADGADSAFESGCDLKNGSKEIYLPWKMFNGNKSPLYNVTKSAYDIAKEFHPNYAKLSMGAAKLIARDSYQILGSDLKSLVKFVLYCADEDASGNVKGGTGQAIRIAKYFKIPTYNIRSICNSIEVNRYIELLLKEVK